MKKRDSIKWGKWLRQHRQDQWIIEEIRRVTKPSKIWVVAAVVIVILSVSTGILLNYLTGLRTTEKIDAAARQIVNLNRLAFEFRHAGG
jgi:hypothetical protein